ncbi:hypothetical protein OG874_00130 [Nocardia sp. NBC_00565]|uniref:hypothetical protein n=1 Tax=Nocardia sp. NBC_00565 TaxID=2975993 RepID=UPI002E80DE5E|nr:hypothetical protein [Nocardia sp. NBC_00565]WUC03661.1 hypothetical protein OG874_00130 [Nocardia sp. NBC_00565]
MSRPGAQDWRRTWTDGRSSFTVEHDVDGRIRVSVDDVEHPGFAANFSRSTRAEIADFIEEGA